MKRGESQCASVHSVKMPFFLFYGETAVPKPVNPLMVQPRSRPRTESLSRYTARFQEMPESLIIMVVSPTVSHFITHPVCVISVRLNGTEYKTAMPWPVVPLGCNNRPQTHSKLLVWLYSSCTDQWARVCSTRCLHKDFRAAKPWEAGESSRRRNAGARDPSRDWPAGVGAEPCPVPWTSRRPRICSSTQPLPGGPRNCLVWDMVRLTLLLDGVTAVLLTVLKGRSNSEPSLADRWEIKQDRYSPEM